MAQLQSHPLLVTTLMVMHVLQNPPITVMEAVIAAGHGHLMTLLNGLLQMLPADANNDCLSVDVNLY